MLNKITDFVIKVVFGMVFLLIVTPVGLLFRIFGIDYLERKVDLSASSYWKKHG